MAGSMSAVHKAFLLCNYTLLGAASACIFLTLSLRLAPSPCGLLLVFLHALTAVFAAAGCSGSFTDGGARAGRAHAAHTVGAVLTAIFQGAAALLAFTRTADFLAELRSYVRDEDGEVILKLVGGLGPPSSCSCGPRWRSRSRSGLMRMTAAARRLMASTARAGRQGTMSDSAQKSEISCLFIYRHRNQK